ncbi:MAG: hypothetical protein ACXAC8_11935 [Candidatus Hodarchaeales archaeon]
MVASYPDNGIGIITNHFKSESMKKYNNPDREMLYTRKKMENTQVFLENKERLIEFESLKRLLNDPINGVLSNKHDTDPDKSLLTIWSWTAKLNERRILIATGTPISGDYSVVKF